ncbi:TraB family protein isoform 1 [Theobroma cacao]|uniref:TraB family protein isoform 1 n=1 Tax=Theobroma cacao TaxID=3641 RepID=A0A061E2E2_THECC|nr:TraB family protein isoform 1 [Theobroma cacao]
MRRLTRPLAPVYSPEEVRSIVLKATFAPPFSQTILPLHHFKQFTPLKPLEFTTSATTANRPNYKPKPPAMEPKPTESDPTSGEDFVHIENPNPNVTDALSESIVKVEEEEEEEEEMQNEDYDSTNSDAVSRSKRSDSSDRRKVELPEELSRSVMVLTCESSAEGGNCDVYLVGTAHVSQESCREVEAVISFLKPQVVFLELCSSRVAVLTPQNLKVPTMGEMIDMWKKKHNMFGILYSWFLAKVASKLEVFPGSEFRVAFEEAMKYGGKVILGDRPVQITLRRTWGKMPLWHKTKLLYSLLFQAVFLPSPEELNKMLKDMDDVDMLTLVIQEMSKEFPTLMETLVHERDQYMSSTLHRIASEHSSVVAVVGKGHLQGIRKHWKQPVSMNDLMAIPSQKPTVSTGKILASLGIAAAGVAIISGIYFACKK